MVEDRSQLTADWRRVERFFRQMTGKTPDLNGVLFLIGVQELGQGPRNFSKEQKQDLMHIAVCRLLSESGYYELEGHDQDGWPHWRLVRPLPSVNLDDQEVLLKAHAVEYLRDALPPKA